MGTSRCVTCINVIKYSKYTSTAWAVRSCQSHQSWSLIDFFIGSAICGGSISSKFTPPNLPSGTWVHIFRVLVVRSLPIASVSSVYQGIDLQYKKHEYGQTLVEYAITWRYGRRPYAVHWYARYGAREPSPVQRSSTDFPDLREIYVQV